MREVPLSLAAGRFDGLVALDDDALGWGVTGSWRSDPRPRCVLPGMDPTSSQDL